MKNCNILLIPNLLKDEDLQLTRRLCQYINSKGWNAYVWDPVYSCIQDAPVKKMQCDLLDQIYAAVPLGGDGTILSSTRKLEGHPIPMLGINLGHVGFLAEVEPDMAEDALERIMREEYHIEQRILLEGELIRNDTEKKAVFTGLNDVVISRNLLSTMTRVGVYINEQYIESYLADGLIVCTPTGSTAYNLSAGGPILAPTAQNLVITPICPHALNVRSIVVAEDDTITLRIGAGKREQERQDPVVMSVDGQEHHHLTYGDTVHVKRSEQTVQIIKLKDNTFYQTLKKKLF